MSYNIYRTVNNATELLNTAPITQTTFLDADSLQGWRSYEVSALSSLGLEGTTTAPESLSVAAMLALALAPEGLQTELFETSTAHTMLSWQAPAGGTAPTGYHIYRGDNGAFPQRITLLPITGLQFTDSTLAAGALCFDIKKIHEGVKKIWTALGDDVPVSWDTVLDEFHTHYGLQLYEDLLALFDAEAIAVQMGGDDIDPTALLGPVHGMTFGL